MNLPSWKKRRNSRNFFSWGERGCFIALKILGGSPSFSSRFPFFSPPVPQVRRAASRDFAGGPARISLLPPGSTWCFYLGSIMTSRLALRRAREHHSYSPPFVLCLCFVRVTRSRAIMTSREPVSDFSSRFQAPLQSVLPQAGHLPTGMRAGGPGCLPFVPLFRLEENPRVGIPNKTRPPQSSVLVISFDLDCR